MAQRSLRPCKQRGCKALTRDSSGYCEDHIHIAEERKAERNKLYDKQIRHKRDKKYTDFYHSDEWEFVRADLLSDYKEIDLYAYYIKNRIVKANTAHHIDELKDNWEKRLDKDNLFPISDINHRKIHSMYKNDKKGTQELLIDILKKWNENFKRSPPGIESF